VWNSDQMAAGTSLRLPSTRRQAARDRAERAGTPSDGRSCRPVVCARHERCSGTGRDEGDPRVTGAATCKIAGIAYTGSNPVPATPTLTCENAVAGRLISPSSTPRFPSGFPPADAPPTPSSAPPGRLAPPGRICPRSARPAAARSAEADGCTRAGRARRHRRGAVARR
jgi:hypothetical protein